MDGGKEIRTKPKGPVESLPPSRGDYVEHPL